MTPYAYVNNNPIMLVDPTRMSAEEGDDWFVNSKKGDILKVRGVSDLNVLSFEFLEKRISIR